MAISSAAGSTANAPMSPGAGTNERNCHFGSAPRGRLGHAALLKSLRKSRPWARAGPAATPKTQRGIL